MLIILIILVLFFYHKYTRFYCIQDEKKYINSNFLHNVYTENIRKFFLEFSEKYKNTDKKIVLKRSNNSAMTIRDTSKYKDNNIKLNLNFDDIIKLDTENEIVHVGSMITMGRLSNYLYKHGYSLPVVPEFKCLTVGGLICGAGLESSSFKYGLFPLLCIEYTVLLGNGEIRDVDVNDAELFSSIPLSYGTLCTILSVKLKIIKIEKFVNLEIIPINKSQEIGKTFEKILKEKDIRKYDFIEGISYSKDLCLIILGFISSESQNELLSDYWFEPFFYQTILKNFN